MAPKIFDDIVGSPRTRSVSGKKNIQEEGNVFHKSRNVRAQKFKRDVTEVEVVRGYAVKVVVEKGKKVLQQKNSKSIHLLFVCATQP